MNRIISLIISFIICLPLSAQEAKNTYAVFVYRDNTVSTPINALRSELVASLIENSKGEYNVVDRSDEILELLKKEYNYQGSGMVREDQLISIGEHLAVNYLCAVGITNYSEYHQYFFDCNIVDLQGRRITKHSHYPDSDNEKKIVSDLGPQTQISVGQALAKHLWPEEEKVLTVGEQTKTLFININGKVVRSEVYRIGYLDGTGEHGLEYTILGHVSDINSLIRIGSPGDLPTIAELKLIYHNRHMLGLYGEYWSRDKSYNKKHKKHKKEFYYTLDFSKNEYDILIEDKVGVVQNKGDKECEMMLVKRF